MPVRNRRPFALAAGLLAAALLAAACGGGSGGGGASPSASASPSAGVQKDAALAAQVPASIRSKGTVTVATDASYAPNEFYAPDNKTIIGMDVDLGKAIGQVLGLKVQFVNASFDGIIPALSGSQPKYDFSMSSFTDNKKREQAVDFVTYFSAGTSLMVKKGNPDKITGPNDLCGRTVAVEKGTVQVDDAAAKSKACTQAGKPAITAQVYPDQNAANLAIQSGRAVAVLADSPVIAYAVKQSNGQFETVGQSYDTAPYGIAIPKSSGTFKDAILGAVKKLIADGTYQQILTKWGVQAGAISNPVINGATS